MEFLMAQVILVAGWFTLYAALKTKTPGEKSFWFVLTFANIVSYLHFMKP